MVSIASFEQGKNDKRFRDLLRQEFDIICRIYPDLRQHLVGCAYEPKVDEHVSGARVVVSIPFLVIGDLVGTLSRIRDGLGMFLKAMGVTVDRASYGSGEDEFKRHVERFVFDIPSEQAELAERVVKGLSALTVPFNMRRDAPSR